MSLFFKREKTVLEMIHKYFAVVDKAMETFREALECYLEEGACEQFVGLDKEIHRHESRADDLRHAIEKEMYSHALLPESRGDLLGLLENFDKIPNLAEVVTFMIFTQRIDVPPAYRPRLGQLVQVNLEAYRLVREAVDRLFENPNAVCEVVDSIDRKESEGDQIERSLIIDVFLDDSVPDIQKILMRELFQRIGAISNRAEALARRLELISLKRRI